MSDLTPTRKQSAVGVTGAASILLIWILAQFGVVMPAEVGAASAVILAWLAGYFTPEGRHAAREE